jgi:hypothetical protein
MNEMPKTKSGWRIMRRILISLAIVFTLIAILYAEEDWRGKHAWENYKHEWEAKGEKFDWQAFVPPSVPNDQNFFTAPIFTKIMDEKISMSPYGSDGGPAFAYDTNKVGYAIYNEYFSDLKHWQDYYRNPTKIRAVDGFVMTNGTLVEQTNYLNHATDEFPIAPQPQTPAKDILFALSKFDPAVEELRQASQRPYANVPLNYEDGFNSASKLLPTLATLKRCTQLLELRVQAELADGQNDKALADLKLLFYLNESLHTSPFLISHLVRMAIVAIGIQPIWESLAKYQWTDEQLVVLENELAKIDFVNDYGSIMRGERAGEIVEMENQRRTRKLVSDTENGIVTNSFWLMPSAYFYQNELSFARMHQEWLLPLVDTNARVVSPSALQHINDVIEQEKKHYSPYKIQALMTASISVSVKKIAQLQCQIDLARVAIALERYRLAHGNYPETIDVLAPKFISEIPHDVINGQPLHYRRTEGGRFVLYSVGWNEMDDGGQVVLTKSGSVDREKGDWVWQYPKNN